MGPEPGPCKPRFGKGDRANVLRLTEGWLANPDAFARPAPAPEPPLPLRFSCNGCGGTVNPDTGRCGGCQAQYDM